MDNRQKLKRFNRPNLKDIDSLIRMNEAGLKAYADLFSSKVTEDQFYLMMLGFNKSFESNLNAWKLIRESLED